MGRAATVYANQLSFYAYGHPLWIPEPITLGGTEHEVQIGDVGYVTEDGAFRRLFNITVGVPDVFEPLQLDLDESTSVIEQFLNPGPFCGKTVEKSLVEGHVSGAVATIGGAGCSYRFTCTSSEGAMLILMDHARKATLGLDDRLVQYMLNSHESWYKFARKHQGFSCRPEDLILVSGTVKTTAWAVAAFFEAGNSTHEVQFDGQFGEVASVGLEYSQQRERSCSFEQRVGPADRDTRMQAHLASSNEATDAMKVYSDVNEDPRPQDLKQRQNQCVFLNYYKIKYRAFPRPKKTKGTAGRSRHRDYCAGLGSDTDELKNGAEVELIDSVAAPHTLLDDILDYILECSTANIAIASHDDIYKLTDLLPLCPPEMDITQVMRYWRMSIALSGEMGRLQIPPNYSSSSAELAAKHDLGTTEVIR